MRLSCNHEPVCRRKRVTEVNEVDEMAQKICGQLVLYCIDENELSCTCYRVKGGASFYLKNNTTGQNYPPFNMDVAEQLLVNQAQNMEFIG